MVYEVECDNCGDILDFGGHDPEDRPVGEQSKIPGNAVKFDGKVYCEECVEEFVKFGIGDVQDKIDFLEDELEDVKEELGMEKGMND
jgi:hypothetical protein